MVTMSSHLDRKDYLSLSLLFILSFFLFADQNLMGPNLSQIAAEFGFNDLERDIKLGGEISLVFWLIGGFFTLFFGYFTDIASRKKLLIISMLFGEIPCFLTGFVENYQQFFWLRALTGIGIGAIIPITYSLLADYFPSNMRSAATGYLGLVVGLGIGGGQLLAGLTGPEYGWKISFIIVSVPNFIFLLLYAIFATEPARGKSDGNVNDITKINSSIIKQLISKKTNILVFLQGIAGTVPWSVFFVYLTDYLAQDIGYSVQMASLVVFVIGLSAMIGGFAGGLIGNKLYNINPKYQPLLSAVCTFIGMVPTAFLINLSPVESNTSVIYPLVLGIFSGFFITITAPNMKAVLMNVNHPNTRGMAFSIYNLADGLGRGFGPFIISFFILQFGRQWGFNLANGIWFFCGLSILLMIKTYSKDQI
ncbi:MAG: MFS transporter [Candidatus Marinimicrobia bacterium]|jgi:MFS family permease|nr:MFS transporter [Candidatus Neomarinimicrobiota bacterium]|tara:strand:+ start:13660 stop:14922 length:1263 start_codon:yes stop_codon:yes gene_type:complete